MRSSNSSIFTASVKTCHSAIVNMSTGPCGFLELRTATYPSLATSSTQLFAAWLEKALRQEFCGNEGMVNGWPLGVDLRVVTPSVFYHVLQKRDGVLP